MWQRGGKKEVEKEARGHGSGRDGQAEFTAQAPSSAIQCSAQDLGVGWTSLLEVRKLLKKKKTIARG